MQNIGAGCEPVLHQLEKWHHSVVTKQWAALGEVLDPEFEIFSDSRIFPGRLDKDGFIAAQPNLHIAKVEILEITARLLDGYIATLIHARVGQSPEPDNASTLKSKRLIYASVWRQSDQSTWRCYRHNILCPTDTDTV